MAVGKKQATGNREQAKGQRAGNRLLVTGNSKTRAKAKTKPKTKPKIKNEAETKPKEHPKQTKTIPARYGSCDRSGRIFLLAVEMNECSQIRKQGIGNR